MSINVQNRKLAQSSLTSSFHLSANFGLFSVSGNTGELLMLWNEETADSCFR